MNVLIIGDPNDPLIDQKHKAAESELKKRLFTSVGFCRHQATNQMEYFILNTIMINQCETVYLLEGWLNSAGAVRFKKLAEDFGLKIIYSLNEYWTKILNDITEISNAIECVFGFSYSKFTSKSRERNYYYARLIFFGLCRKHGYSLDLIAMLLNRDHTTAFRLNQNFDDELKFNQDFKALNEKVLDVFNNNIPGHFLSEKECVLKINQLRNSKS